MDELSLRQIVERCQQGDKQAFGPLYNAMHDRLRMLCRRFVSDEATADDLLHDSFILIFSKIGTLKDADKAEAWMTTVTRNLAQAWLQRQKQDPTVPLDRLHPSLDAVDPMPTPITYDEILHLVDALPQSYRQVFRLSVLEGMSHQEIAALLNIDPHTSSSELSRAKLLLRRWLAPIVLLLMTVILPLGWHLMQEDVIGERGEKGEAVASQAGSEKVEGEREKGEAVVSQAGSKKGEVRSKKYVAVATPVAETASEETAPVAQDSTKLEETMELSPMGPISPISPMSPIEPMSPIGPTSRGWTIDLAYSGMGGNSDLRLPYADADTNPAVYDSVSHHRMPLTVALTVNRRLGEHWQVGLGLQYTRLSSEMQSGNSYVHLLQQQRVQYLGLPLSVEWHYPLTNRLSTYATANVTLQLPLRSTLDSRYVLNGSAVETSTERLHPGQQWSTGLGLGLQYDVTPVVGFFVEPSLQYHFRNGSGVETWQTEHPAAFSLPFGLRITF